VGRFPDLLSGMNRKKKRLRAAAFFEKSAHVGLKNRRFGLYC